MSTIENAMSITTQIVIETTSNSSSSSSSSSVINNIIPDISNIVLKTPPSSPKHEILSNKKIVETASPFDGLTPLLLITSMGTGLKTDIPSIKENEVYSLYFENQNSKQEEEKKEEKTNTIAKSSFLAFYFRYNQSPKTIDMNFQFPTENENKIKFFFNYESTHEKITYVPSKSNLGITRAIICGNCHDTMHKILNLFKNTCTFQDEQWIKEMTTFINISSRYAKPSSVQSKT